MVEISTAKRDMLVMATTEVGVHQAKNSSRKKVTYRYHNTEVYIDTFLFIYAISGKYLKTIRAWYLANGLFHTSMVMLVIVHAMLLTIQSLVL